MATIKLIIGVERLDNVLTQFDQIKVYRSTTGQDGVYSEITSPSTRVPLVAGVSSYEYIDATGDPSYWYRTSYFHSITSLESSLSEPRQGEDAGGLYCSVDDLRSEGITTSMLSDARALDLIRLAGEYLEIETGYWFEPRERTFRIKGDGGRVQRIGHPIIRIDEVAIAYGVGASYDESEISLDNIVVYNRHLTQGLLRPDDRNRPMIEIAEEESAWSAVTTFLSTRWVKVVGLFGYTALAPGDTPGESEPGSQIPLSFGSTPRQIQEVTKRLVVRDLGLLSEPEMREDWRDRWRLTSEKTREQSYTKTSLATLARVGGYTGDPDIDEIIASFATTRSQVEAI